jgi:hypothetical protein
MVKARRGRRGEAARTDRGFVSRLGRATVTGRPGCREPVLFHRATYGQRGRTATMSFAAFRYRSRRLWPAHLVLWACLFSVLPARAEASVAVTIVEPGPGRVFDKDVRVAVTVASTYEIRQVTAQVDTRTVDLTFTGSPYCPVPCHAGWTGTLSLAGLSSGDRLLTVTAVDALGNLAQAQHPLTVDQRPTLIVTSPIDGTVGRPDVHVAASCIDDNPQWCASVWVYARVWSDDGDSKRTYLAGGTTSIAQTISLAAYDGMVLDLLFEATDSAGWRVYESRTVYVDMSPRLTEVASVNGPILDVQPERILFSDDESGAEALYIHDRLTGDDTEVPQITGQTPGLSFLTPHGAMFVASGQDYRSARVYDWRDGTLISLGFPNSSTSLAVSGNYAIWSGEPDGASRGTVTLFRRDLVAGTTLEIQHGVGNEMNDVAENGDVVFWGGGYDIFRYRAGTETRLTADTVLWNTYPLTDGINVAYRKHTPCCGSQTYALTLFTDGNEITLAPARSVAPRPYRDYQLSNGWTAFTRTGGGGELQVWVRSPSGEQNQLTFFSTSSIIDALAPTGEVMFVHDDRRYLAVPPFSTGAAVDIGPAFGRSIWLDGQWIIVMGRSLFSINAAPLPVTLSVTKAGLGEGTVTSASPGIDCGPTCTTAFDANTSVSLTAVAAPGSIFTGWSGEGCRRTGPCVVRMTHARNVTATFTLQISAVQTLQFSASSYQAAGEGPRIITVTRTGLGSTISVTFTASNGTAAAGQDYTATSGRLTFAPNERSKTFAVPLINDTLTEGGETINLRLSNPGGRGTLGTPRTAVLTIMPNDTPRLQLSSAAYEAVEGVPASITVTRSGGFGTPITVRYATSNGTATAARDYTAVAGTLSFGPNDTSKTFTVPISNDTVTEGPETINLTLSNPGGGASLGARGTAVLTIAANDRQKVEFTSATYTAGESSASKTITVRRTGGLNGTITVQYATTPGTAVAGRDYSPVAGTLTFRANETQKAFTVPIINDGKHEGSETINLTLSGQSAGVGLGEPRAAVLTILANDAP